MSGGPSCWRTDGSIHSISKQVSKLPTPHLQKGSKQHVNICKHMPTYCANYIMRHNVHNWSEISWNPDANAPARNKLPRFGRAAQSKANQPQKKRLKTCCTYRCCSSCCCCHCCYCCFVCSCAVGLANFGWRLLFFLSSLLLLLVLCSFSSFWCFFSFFLCFFSILLLLFHLLPFPLLPLLLLLLLLCYFLVLAGESHYSIHSH